MIAVSAVVFVLLGGFNVWTMLAGPSGIASRPQSWMRVHRAVGYLFAGMFVLVTYIMLLRLKGYPDEPPPRILLHMSLAMLLAPLLIVKILIARRQKAARGLLSALGIAIFAIAFTLVALNISTSFLRSANSTKVPVSHSLIFALVVIAGFSALFFRRPISISPQAAPMGERFADQAPVEGSRATSLLLARIEPQTRDAKTLRFLVPPAQRLSPRPGQFLTFEWMIAGKRVCRSYSICSSPTQTGYIEITPKRVAHGCVSVFLNDHALPGLSVKVRGPFGHFCFDEHKHRRIVLLAGGSGITPMMAILRYIDDLCIPVEVTLINCVRTESDVLFRAELSELAKRLRTFQYLLVLSQPAPDWHGPRGHLTQELLRSGIEKPETKTFFLCGPQPFMEHVQTILEKMRVQPEQILRESFGNVSLRNPASVAESLRIEFARSRTIAYNTPGTTILAAAEKLGLQLPYGCRQGLCGTCATVLRSGKVRMDREDGLTEDLKARGYILPCVSHAVEDVRLEA